ncbi:hypothetical protein CGK40_25610, partial [Vibrio parahaemolyticus]
CESIKNQNRARDIQLTGHDARQNDGAAIARRRHAQYAIIFAVPTAVIRLCFLSREHSRISKADLYTLLI